MTAQLNLKNLFDKRYYVSEHQFSPDWILPGAPRTLTTSIGWNYTVRAYAARLQKEFDTLEGKYESRASREALAGITGLEWPPCCCRRQRGPNSEGVRRSFRSIPKALSHRSAPRRSG